LNIDGQTIELLEGQSAIAKTDVPHAYSNQADVDLVFTMSVAELHR
jgi:quercetin dioxygenase-like cupin family protein